MYEFFEKTKQPVLHDTAHTDVIVSFANALFKSPLNLSEIGNINPSLISTFLYVKFIYMFFIYIIYICLS